MAVSLNAVGGGVSSTAKYQNFPRIHVGASVLKASQFPCSPCLFDFHRSRKLKTGIPHLLVAKSDPTIAEFSDKASEKVEVSLSDDKPLVSSANELGHQIPQVSNGSTASPTLKQDASFGDVKSPVKRARVTAREKLRAARVLSRNSESKPRPKPQLGSSVLAVLRESDKGKRSGLPEAPSNMLDDSKRGMPKKGLTWELPVGVDVALIIFSVVFISTVMFTTTYIVWKVGAIHFNEY